MEARQPEGIHRAPAAARVRPLAPVAILWIACVASYGVLRTVNDRGSLLESLMQVAYMVPFVAAAIATVMAHRVSHDGERRFWWALSVGMVIGVAGEGYVSVRLAMGLDLTGGWPVLPVVLGFISSAFVLVGLFRLTDLRALSGLVRGRHLVDAAGASFLLVGVEVALVLVPITRAYDQVDSLELLATVGYSITGVLLAIATAINFVSRSWGRWRPCEREVILGIGVYSFATVLWPIWYVGAMLHSAVPWDGIIEVLWMTGMLLVFGGAFARSRTAEADGIRFRAMPRMRPRRHGALSVTGPVLFALGIPVFGFLSMTQPIDPVLRSAYAVASLGLTGVVALRSGIAAMENESLFDRVVNDPVTELLGHRYFHERLQMEIDLAQRHGDVLSIIVIDLDEFSRVNSALGHSGGDNVLREAGRAMKTACRGSDVVCRLSADEFAVILPAASIADAEMIAARIRVALRGLDLGECGHLCASIGIAGFPDDADDREALVHRADGALYWAKYHGKDRAVVFDASVIESLSAQDRIEKLEQQSHLATVRALAAAVDARDPLTQFHSRNVAVLAVMLAEEMDLDSDKRSLIEIAALLHDIGKIGISDRVLRKRGALNAVEMRHIREHPGLGERILMSTQLVEILPWVRHHHERWDGTGYPDGLAAEAIPLEARLLSICDAYDAMTTGRPYRTAMSSSAALQELDLCVGAQFDPALTEAFMRMVGRRKLLRPDTHFERE